MTRVRQPIDILLVEDNPADRDLIQWVARESGTFPSHRFFEAVDGQQAIEFLHRKGQFSSAPCPDMIILDLNLPRKDGREVLGEIKADPTLRRIPVLILTSSDDLQDIVTCYDSHANGYIRKPDGLDGFKSLLDSIDQFWFRVSTLPPKMFFPVQ